METDSFESKKIPSFKRLPKLAHVLSIPGLKMVKKNSGTKDVSKLYCITSKFKDHIFSSSLNFLSTLFNLQQGTENTLEAVQCT
jgi:hypothetical protein